MIFTNDGLCVPKSYYDASPEELTHIVNGCGAAGSWLSTFIPERFSGLDISLACDIHDWMYHYGIEWADKLTADRVFMYNMMVIIDNAEIDGDNPAKSKRRRDKGELYFDFVSIFGKSAYLVGKNGIKSKESVMRLINKSKSEIKNSLRMGVGDMY